MENISNFFYQFSFSYHPNGGWPWDFWTIRSQLCKIPPSQAQLPKRWSLQRTVWSAPAVIFSVPGKKDQQHHVDNTNTWSPRRRKIPISKNLIMGVLKFSWICPPPAKKNASQFLSFGKKGSTDLCCFGALGGSIPLISGSSTRPITKDLSVGSASLGLTRFFLPWKPPCLFFLGGVWKGKERGRCPGYWVIHVNIFFDPSLLRYMNIMNDDSWWHFETLHVLWS